MSPAQDGNVVNRRRRLKEEKSQPDEEGSKETGVLYIGHLPHGFYEDELKGFLSQFGAVQRVRVSRSKKTARSRGYAFVEFETAEVAKIVAQTMNGYLMFGQRLDVQLLRSDKVHPETFKNANRKFKQIPWRKLEKQKREAPKSAEQLERIQKKRASIRARRYRRLESLGIEDVTPS